MYGAIYMKTQEEHFVLITATHVWGNLHEDPRAFRVDYSDTCMYVNATENTKQSALLHSLDDAFNIDNVESDPCSATTLSSSYCVLLLSVFFNNTVENTLLLFHGDAFNIYTDNMSISTTQKTIKITRVAFVTVALCIVAILQDRLFT
jgi:hypothetical protein